MVDLSKEIDFSKEISEDPSLLEYLSNAAKEITEDADPEAIQKPELDLELKNIILVTGLPQVPKDKLTILSGIIATKVLKALDIDENGGLREIKMGSKQTGDGTGCMILKYETQDQAQRAINQINGKKFDAKHTFEADFLKIAEDILNSGEEEYVEPTIIKREAAQYYNIDNKYRDQFVYKENDEIQLNWFDFMEKKPIKATEGTIKFEKCTKVEWSPLGTYLVVYLGNGFSLHSGPTLLRVGWFPHNKVLNVRFSPDESYAVSFNGTVYAPDRQNFVVWEVKVNKKLRSFRAEQTQHEQSFKFSHDSKYIAGAFTQSQQIAVFELPEMAMLAEPKVQTDKDEKKEEKKSTIPVKFIQRFAWHTTKHILICLSFSTNRNKQESVSTTRVTVIEVPSRRELKWKSWAHEAGNGNIVVAANGEWAAVILQKLHKKKVVSTVVQVASFKKKELEIDMVEVPEKQVDVSFDVNNGRFAIVTCNVDTKASLVKLFTSYFFLIDQEGKDQTVKMIGQVTNQNTDKVLLSHNGLFFVMFSLDGKGNFTTGYFNKTQTKTSMEVIKANSSHAYMNYLTFDPSGKFLLLGSYQSKSIQIWTILGELLFRDAVMRPLANVNWRPRLVKAMNPKEEQELFDNWKSIKSKHEELDDRIINSIKYEREEEQKRLKTQFSSFLEKKRAFYEKFVEERERIQKIKEKTARTAVYEVREKIDPIKE